MGRMTLWLTRDRLINNSPSHVIWFWRRRPTRRPEAGYELWWDMAKGQCANSVVSIDVKTCLALFGIVPDPEKPLRVRVTGEVLSKASSHKA